MNWELFAKVTPNHSGTLSSRIHAATYRWESILKVRNGVKIKLRFGIDPEDLIPAEDGIVRENKTFSMINAFGFSWQRTKHTEAWVEIHLTLRFAWRKEILLKIGFIDEMRTAWGNREVPQTMILYFSLMWEISLHQIRMTLQSFLQGCSIIDYRVPYCARNLAKSSFSDMMRIQNTGFSMALSQTHLFYFCR